MRISRKKRPDKPLIPHYNTNEHIAVTEVRLLGVENENLGIMKTQEALNKAREIGVDLVEINPKADPPVCKLVEFTKFKYQKEKEAKKQKACSHESEIKGIRLSVRIGEHDLNVRMTQAEGFLDSGDRVKAEIILRGRENARPDLAFGVLNDFYKKLLTKMDIRLEQEPTKQGNKITAIMAKK